MALLDRLKLRYETDLTDAELQLVIDEANAEVIRRYGPHSDAANPITETIVVEEPAQHVYPSRPVSTVSSVTEYTGSSVGTETTTILAADDYRLLYGGRALRRLSSGANARAHWGHRVDLKYVPENDGNQRQEVILKLSMLSLQYRGVQQEKAGDYSASYTDYRRECESILGGLHQSGASLLS